MENGFLKEQEKEDQRTYRFSLWWVNNRERARRLGLGLFFAFDAALVLFAAWTFLDGFVVSYERERLAMAEMVAYGQADIHARTRAEAARDLQTGPATVLALEDGRVDVYAPLVNPNDDWWVEFTYAFRAGDAQTEPVRTFVLPGQERPLLAFATTELGSARAATVEISDVTWRRVDRHLTGDYATWEAERLDLRVTDAQFEPSVPLDGRTIARVSFTVTNASAFSYYDPVFFVLLRRGTSVVGVSQTTVDSLDAGATRGISLNWFGPVPAVSTVEVVPHLNIFDLNAYKPLPGETPSDTRARVFVR